MRRTTAIGAAAFAAILGFAGTAGTRLAVAQQPTCLHGEDERVEQLARRRQALGFARHIGSQEATAAATNGGAYQPPERLSITQTLPSRFQFRLSTSGRSYAYSVIDTSDPCRFGYFSDENGVIFRGEAIRSGRD
jgi:hypothetical protein